MSTLTCIDWIQAFLKNGLKAAHNLHVQMTITDNQGQQAALSVANLLTGPEWIATPNAFTPGTQVNPCQIDPSNNTLSCLFKGALLIDLYNFPQDIGKGDAGNLYLVDQGRYMSAGPVTWETELIDI